MSAKDIKEYRDRYLPVSVRVWVSRSRFVLLWRSRAGYVFAGRCLPFLSQTADDQVGEIFTQVWSEQMKRKDLAKSKSLASHADPLELKKSYPSLAEFMTAATFEGSKDRRESPTVTLWATGGTWRASIKDRAEGLVLWLSAPLISELLLMMESFVLSAEAPWRHDDQDHARNGKRKQKGS